MSPRILLLVLAGLGFVGIIVLERPLRRFALSIPILYVGLGTLVFALPFGLPVLDPVGDPLHARAAEYLTEFIVIMSLAGAGLSIDRPFGRRKWTGVWPLLFVTMPLCITAVALMGWGWLGLTPSAALLLAAALAPTDPVLANSVQVGPPHERVRNDVRFGLTVEAGLNDGLAFPFTYLALAAVGQGALGGWVLEWAALDLVYRVVTGVGMGLLVGRALGWFVFERAGSVVAPDGIEEGVQANEGLVLMAGVFLAYGLAEVIGGYGFLAVFVAAVVGRHHAKDHDYHLRTHRFADQVEQVVLTGMLIGFGGLLASGILAPLTLPAAGVAAMLVLVVRPLTGLFGLVRRPLPWAGRAAIAFFGIRGMGTLYYLAYGQNHASFAGLELVWATAAFTILLSIVVHGVTTAPLMQWLEGRGDHVERGVEASEAPL